MRKKRLLIIFLFIAPGLEFYGSYCLFFLALLGSSRDTLLGWRGFYLGKKRRKVWKAAPLCIFWAVWKERNMIAFDNEELSIHTLKILLYVIFDCGLSRL